MNLEAPAGSSLIVRCLSIASPDFVQAKKTQKRGNRIHSPSEKFFRNFQEPFYVKLKTIRVSAGWFSYFTKPRLTNWHVIKTGVQIL